MRTALDTNILARVLTRDDQDQHLAARAFLAANDCIVQTTVLLELEWVLRSVHRYSATQIAAAFEVLLATEKLEVEDAGRLRTALAGVAAGIDFPDAYHLAGAERASAFATFDDALRRRATRAFSKPPVVRPATASQRKTSP